MANLESMEASPDRSPLADVRKIEQESSMDVVESSRYLASRGATYPIGSVFRGDTTTTSGRQVIELSERERLRRFEIANTDDNGDATSSRRNVERPRTLAPDTVVIRQGARSGKAIAAGYRRELTETNSSSGSSSGSGRASLKVKRIRRAVRNKTRKAVEVRRNPLRTIKKDIDKDFLHSRQRLLANDKREVRYEAGKRARTSATPYMNTRSVTRKMYTVGATYQAPTRKDETEWKEWPVHGMHERPVYHPQLGLAAEYLGRYFTSLDGSSYCEIVQEPEIEVVAVDPHCDRRACPAKKKSTVKARARSRRSSKDDVCLATRSGSFETCMHGSLHCVLGYCSQVFAPSYKRAPEEEGRPAAVTAARTGATATENVNVNVNAAEEAKLLEGYAIAMAHSIRNKSARRVVSSTVASLLPSAAYAQPEAPRSTVESAGSKSTAQSGKVNLSSTLRRFPNASLVLLKSTASRTGREVCETKDAKDAFEVDDAASIGDKTMSSFYEKMMSSSEESPARSSLYALKKHTAKKIVLAGQPRNAKTIQVTRKTDESGDAKNDVKTKTKQPDGGQMPTTSCSKSRAWYTSETSEIAKILSEYNRSATKKSAIQIYNPASRNVKVNLASFTAKDLPKATLLWQKDTSTAENRSVGPDLSQERRLLRLPTLEKTKDTWIADRNVGTSGNRQSFSRNPQMSASYAREKPVVARKDHDEPRRAVDAKRKEATPERFEDREETEISKTEESLQELLENTAILYCAANGVHQDDLSSYIDTLDGKQSIQWLQSWNNSAT